MLIEKPILHPLAADALAALARDGIACDPDEILWLHEAARQEPDPADKSLFLDFPVLAGGVRLFPLSVGAKEWLRRHSDWFRDSYLFMLALAFCAAHARNPQAFLALSGKWTAIFRVLNWSLRINCSAAQLRAAMDRCFPDHDLVDVKTPNEEREAKTGRTPERLASDWGLLLAKLSHFYPGRRLSYWLWEVSDETAAALIAQCDQFLDRDQRSDSKSAAFRRFVRFRLVIQAIRAAHAGSPNAQTAEPDPDGRQPQGPGVQDSKPGRISPVLHSHQAGNCQDPRRPPDPAQRPANLPELPTAHNEQDPAGLPAVRPAGLPGRRPAPSSAVRFDNHVQPPPAPGTPSAVGNLP